MDKFGWLAVVIIVILLAMAVAPWCRKRQPQPPAAQVRAVGDKPSARLTKADLEAANTFDHLSAVGKELTPMQVEKLCEALAAIDDCREDAPPGTPVREELESLFWRIDRLAGASVK